MAVRNAFESRLAKLLQRDAEALWSDLESEIVHSVAYESRHTSSMVLIAPLQNCILIWPMSEFDTASCTMASSVCNSRSCHHLGSTL
jgi:hypothetical protein